ncbi:MAG: aldehyde dehydrogenase [Bdellovibrio sp.]|nr:aldehyde dehydrogenase [Bdellovibrio sp.]
MDLQNFIGGAFVPAESQKTFSKLSPFSGEVVARVAHSDAMDVIKALQSAKKAQPLIREMTRADRAGLLNKMAEYLQAHSDEIAYQEALHQGLSHHFTLENSVKPAIVTLQKNARAVVAEELANIVVQPSGLVGIITSWNLSLKLVVERLAPALAAGNAMIVKVSEHSPITAKILAEAISFAGVPAGSVNFIQGFSDVAQIIAGHPSVRAITFVGKSSSLESIVKAGTTQCKKMQLAGGAKNSGIALTDTDYKANIAQILSPFLVGQGQLCWNVTRLFVLEAMAEDFMKTVQEFMSSLKALKDPRGAEMWTPLISEKSRQHIDEKVQEGVGEHGKVFSGGKICAGPGFFYEPTVMLDLPNCSVLQQDELAGPLLIVTPVKYQHEAVKWTNTSYLGHSAVVWGPTEKALKVAQQIEAAQVWINTWMKGEETESFGFKQSGFGNPDMRWNGSFYSDVKKLAGSL